MCTQTTLCPIPASNTSFFFKFKFKPAHMRQLHLNVSGQPANCQAVDSYTHLATPIDVKPWWLRDETEIITRHLTDRPAKTASNQTANLDFLLRSDWTHILKLNKIFNSLTRRIQMPNFTFAEITSKATGCNQQQQILTGAIA